MALANANTLLTRGDNPEGVDTAALDTVAAAGATVALAVPFGGAVHSLVQVPARHALRER